MEGDALLLCFRSGLIRASSSRPKLKHNRTLLHKVTILAKAINKDKPFSPLDVSILTRIERIERMAVVEIDQKVCCFPQAYALAA